MPRCQRHRRIGLRLPPAARESFYYWYRYNFGERLPAAKSITWQGKAQCRFGSGERDSGTLEMPIARERAPPICRDRRIEVEEVEQGLRIK